MGIYNTYVEGEIQVQLKVGDLACKVYKVGDECELEDGIYIAPEGGVAVNNKKVVLVTNNVQDKWGGGINVEENSPVYQALQEEFPGKIYGAKE